MRPSTVQEAVAMVREAGRVVIGSHGDAVPALDLSALTGSLEIEPENLTASFLAGTSVVKIQAALAHHGLWWPVDAAPARTLGAVLATGGPHPGRTGYGPVRDWVLGLSVVLKGGQLVRCGGTTMKNVAGYDLTRLFVGSRGTLGAIVSATLRLLPRPERMESVVLPRDQWRRALDLAAACEWDGERLLVRVDGRESQVRRRLGLLGGEPARPEAWQPWYERAGGRYRSRAEPDWSQTGAPLAGLWRTEWPDGLSPLEERIREAIAPGRCFNPHLYCSESQHTRRNG